MSDEMTPLDAMELSLQHHMSTIPAPAPKPAVDLRRAVSARAVDDIETPDAGPGSVEVLKYDGVVWGYGFACPGCGSKSYLALDGENPEPRWTVTQGDPAKPETVTLTPSIHHTTSLNGCGWHGYLTAGVFTPC